MNYRALVKSKYNGNIYIVNSSAWDSSEFECRTKKEFIDRLHFLGYIVKDCRSEQALKEAF